MGVMYNYDGPIEGIHAYNLLLQSMLTILEMPTIPSFSQYVFTISYIYPVAMLPVDL